MLVCLHAFERFTLRATLCLRGLLSSDIICRMLGLKGSLTQKWLFSGWSSGSSGLSVLCVFWVVEEWGGFQLFSPFFWKNNFLIRVWAGNGIFPLLCRKILEAKIIPVKEHETYPRLHPPPILFNDSIFNIALQVSALYREANAFALIEFWSDILHTSPGHIKRWLLSNLLSIRYFGGLYCTTYKMCVCFLLKITHKRLDQHKKQKEAYLHFTLVPEL